MNNLELLHDLNRRHARLEVEFFDLKDDLNLLNLRLNREKPAAAVPPPFVASPPTLPEAASATPPPVPEPLTAAPIVPAVAPLPEIPSLPVAPQTEPEPEAAPVDGAGLELQFGRWLARLGVVFALFTVVFFSAMVYQYLGPWSKLGGLTLASVALIAGGMWLERRDAQMLVYARTLAGGGMACLYYTLYGATYVPQLQVIPSPLIGGVLLLAWSAGVLMLAERRKSELLSIFAISLAYFSSAITPGNGFSMTADLILAATAVIFQLRNEWTGLSYLCLVGTYAGFLRQAVDVRGPLDFQWVGALEFWPAAVYLSGAWLIFSSAILLSRSPHFAAGKRMAFLCLNNGAWVGLLLVAAQLGAFGHLGEILEATGFVLLGACAVAQVMQPDASDLGGAYLAQGLGLLTGGVAIAYSGVTRGLLITIESVFLVASGAFSRKLVLRLGGGATAVLGAWYLAGELVFSNVSPWMLTFGGALAMLANAWLARRELWGQPREVANGRWVPEAVVHVLLALSLLFLGIYCHADVGWITPGLALATLVLTLSVYFIPLFEVPPLAQVLLVIAQYCVLLTPFFDGQHRMWRSDVSYFYEPQWSMDFVAGTTFLLTCWWSRQKLVRTRGWLQPLAFLFAIALAAYCLEKMPHQASGESWMIIPALLSLVFVGYATWSRLWAFAIIGQLLLAISVNAFLNPHDYLFAWAWWPWWAAAIPIAVVFGTGWIVREVLPRYVKAENKVVLGVVARIYQSVALGLLMRWVFGVTPSSEITFALTALSTAFVFGGLRLRSSYGVRSGFVLAAAGIAHYLAAWGGTFAFAFTWSDAAAFALLLAQPALVRHLGRELISDEESWLLILASAATGWLFVSNAVSAADPHNLTLGWAIFALALTVIGFAANERRQRWCGLAILVAAFIRVGVHDFWIFSDVLKVLTFFALTVICLGLSFLYFKFGDRLKEWL